MISYSQLYSWRNFCEWLNARWYKFAYIERIQTAISEGELKVLPFVYSASGRQARSLLYLNLKIQFVSYRLLPVVGYWGRKRLKYEFGKEVFYKRGWCLVSDWELKIDFLEQMVLFGRKDDHISKRWLPRLEARITERQRRQQQAQQNQKLASLLAQKNRLERYLQGYCPNCPQPLPVVPLMMDCPSCGKSYED